MEKRLLHAAEQGDARAQFNLGMVYDNGLDDNGYAIPGTRPWAVKWLLAAAQQGLPGAQVKLAEIYAEAPDADSLTTAAGWFMLAALSLHGVHLHRARTGYDRVAASLTPVQVAEARHFAECWTMEQPAAAPASPRRPHTGGTR